MISRKILAGYVGIAAFTLFTGLAGIYAVKTLRSENEIIEKNTIPQLLLLGTARNEGLRVVASTTEYSLLAGKRFAGDAESLRRERMLVTEAVTRCREAVKGYLEIVDSPAEERMGNRLRELSEGLFTRGEELTAVVDRGEPRERLVAAKERFERAEAAFNDAVNEAARAEDGEFQHVKGAISADTGKALQWLSLICLISFLSAVAMGHAVGRAITVPLARLREGTERVARGDLEVPIEVGSRDELGELTESFNTMTADLATFRKKLLAANRLTEKILSSLAHGVFVANADAGIVKANDALSQLVGRSIEELLGSNPQELFADHEECEGIRAALRRGETVLNRLLSLRTRTGTVPVLFSATTVTEDDGTPLSVALVQDISERIRIEEALRSSREQLQAIVSASPISISAIDTDGIVTLWNPASTRIFGWTEEEALGRFLPFVPPEKREESRLLRERLAKGESLIGVELHRRKKDGTPIDISLYNAPMRGADGSVTGIMSIIMDITEQKRSERILRESEEKFRNLSQQFNVLLDALPDTVCLLDRENRIVWCNHALSVELGGDPRGAYCFEARHGSEKPCHDCPTTRTFATGKMQNQILTRTDGRVFDIRAVPVSNEEGAVANVIEIARDITDQRRIEMQLNHSQKMEAIGTLAGGIAHDFNNILTTVVGYAGILKRKIGEDDPLRAKVDHILTAADRATALTTALLAYGRKESLNLRPVRLNDVVSQVERLVTRIIGEDIEVVLLLSADDLTVLADVGQLEQVVMNLATNARDAMPAGGILQVTTAGAVMDRDFVAAHGYGAPGSYALLTVSDTGTGMDEATRERVFEPYFTTKEIGKGSGLGLSIVYAIVKQHRGFISVYSEPGKGTTFRIYLPLSPEPATAQPPEERTAAPGGDETILLVEDSDTIRTYLHELLADHGYRVVEAADGQEAVERFREGGEEIDLVLMDVIMPKKNGKEALEEIRALQPGVKALFMSGYTREIISRKGIDAEGLDFISKPANPATILATIREILDRPCE